MVGLKQPHQHACDFKVFVQCFLYEKPTIRKADLPHIAHIRAQDQNLMPVEIRTHHQAVETVILNILVPSFEHGALKIGFNRCDVDIALKLWRAQFKIMHPDTIGCVPRLDLKRQFRNHAQSHILQDRHNIRQRDRLMRVIKLEAQLLRSILRIGPVEIQGQLAALQNILNLMQVKNALLGAVMRGVADRERLTIFQRQTQGIA